MNPTKLILLAVAGATAGAVVSVIVLKSMGFDTDAATIGGIGGGVGAAVAYLVSVQSNKKSD